MLHFATGNNKKFVEIKAILGSSVKQVKIDLPEIQAIEAKKVVKEKLLVAFENLKKPVLVEDTALYIKAWHDLPGALFKWFASNLGDKKICEILKSEKNRKAVAEAVIGYYDGKRMKIFSGQIEGTLAKKPIGKYKFGFDQFFIPKGYNKTFAQLGPSIKNKISHRAKALKKLQNYFKK